MRSRSWGRETARGEGLAYVQNERIGPADQKAGRSELASFEGKSVAMMGYRSGWATKVVPTTFLLQLSILSFIILSLDGAAAHVSSRSPTRGIGSLSLRLRGGATPPPPPAAPPPPAPELTPPPASPLTAADEDDADLATGLAEVRPFAHPPPAQQILHPPMGVNVSFSHDVGDAGSRGWSSYPKLLPWSHPPPPTGESRMCHHPIHL